MYSVHVRLYSRKDLQKRQAQHRQIEVEGKKRKKEEESCVVEVAS